MNSNLNPETAFMRAKEDLKMLLERDPQETEILDYAICLQKRALKEELEKLGVCL